MKSGKSKVIGIALLILLIAAALIATYFYVGFYGNPISRMSKEKEILKAYEVRYGKKFSVNSSTYSFKTKKYSFNLSPLDKPEVKFDVDEINQNSDDKKVDYYGKALAEFELTKKVMEVLKGFKEELNYKVSTNESLKDEPYEETDPIKRLKENGYSTYISWKSTKTTQSEVDALAVEFAKRIKDNLNLKVMNLSIGVSTFDLDNNYYSKEIKISDKN